MIENLGATFDMYDAIDLSDNHIRKLDGFPMLPRLSTLYLNNNKIWLVVTYICDCDYSKF